MKSQNVFGDLNFICSNQSISTGAPIETEYNDIYTSCHWQPLTTYIEFYQIIIESGTTFTFTITPNAQVDYDFASWLNPDPSNLGYSDRSSQNNPFLTNVFSLGLSLTELNQLCEGGNSTGYPEPGMVRYYEVQPGDMIIIAIDRYMDDDQGYTLSFGGNAELSCTFTYSLCDGDGNGQEDFNLNDIALDIQQTRYPEYNVSFYDTLTNAQNGTGIGLLTGNHTAYTANNPNIIYARLENQSGGFIEAVDIKLNVNGFPEIDEFPTLFYCGDPNDLGFFNLTEAFENIINDPENYSIKFYRSLQGAQNENINEEILSPLSYLSESATVYVRIRNEFGCHVIKELNLVVADNLTPQNIQHPLICLEETNGNLNLEDFRESLTDANYNSYNFEYYLNQTDAQNGNTGNSITSPENFPIVAGTTYTIYVRIIMGTNCSPIVSSISFTVGLIPTLTIDSSQNVCSGESITLTAQTQSGLTVNWYDSQNSTTPIFTGNNFSTSNLTEGTTYWVEAVSLEGCASERISVEIIVNELPTFTFENVEICINTSAELEVTTDAGNTVNWYDSLAGTTPIFTGNPFITPNLTSGTSYWVEVLSAEGCPGERQEIVVEIVESIIPEFDLEEQYCVGNELIDLPNLSENNISGTWSPSQIDTSILGIQTFVFTPDPDQCADEFTLEIEVTDSIEPIFDLESEYCKSDELITLPTQSDNGITGTWTPNQIDTSVAGIQNFMFTPDENQCSEPFAFSVEIFETLIPAFDLQQEYCLGVIPQALENVSDNGIPGTWFPAQIDTTTAGTQIYTFTPDGICGEEFILEITILDEIIPTFNIQTQYCLNSEEIILPTTSDNNVSGTWFPAVINTSNLGTTTYTFTPDLECAQGIQITIEITEIITPEFDDLIQNYCLNATPEILPTTSNNGISGTWFPAQINTNLQGTTTYIFTPNAEFCSEPFDLNVTVYPHPDMDLEEELIICEGDSFTYSAPDGFDSYEWKNQNNQIISTTQEVTFTQEGIYTLTVQINGVPCDLSRNIEVRFSTPPTITEIKTTENTIT
ncbi:immunoglobulin domain-containing protein, partial [Moheibacter sediminis]